MQNKVDTNSILFINLIKNIKISINLPYKTAKQAFLFFIFFRMYMVS